MVVMMGSNTQNRISSFPKNPTQHHVSLRIPFAISISISKMKMNFPYAYFLLLLAILQCLAVVCTGATCHPDDQAGLLSFKSGITADPSGMLSNWTAKTNCCTWPGITCLNGNRVTAIMLYGQPDKPNDYLTGTISSSLSKLRYLGGIYFQNLRNMTGPFPSFFFLLPDLTYVYIDNNRLSGKLPNNIGNLSKKLYALSFNGNRFSGEIPASISQLTGLVQLNLGGNLLSGPIPQGIGKLKNLSVLAFDRNQLSGLLPDVFGSLQDLYLLTLSHNKFSGKIPKSLSALSARLRYLEIGHNSLAGQIPDFLGNFRALDTLDLSWNNFSGVVPKTFANLTKIFNLDLSHNQLTEPFPELKIKGIESLDLSHNKFRLGRIPKWVTSSPLIYSLKLAKCGIKMKLDDWKPAETYFYDYIDLSENQISGSPVVLLNRTGYLVEFSASGNLLKFNLESLKFPKTLKQLDLSRNLVFGKVPTAVSGLNKLNVSHNHLCGTLPATKFPASAFAGNDCLCGSPLPSCKA